MSEIEKASAYTTQLETRIHEMVLDARRRRAYVHSMAMNSLTPKQYARAIPILSRYGYGVNIFPIHHTHPPLTMAIYKVYVDIARSLLEKGADPNLSYPTNKGRTSVAHELIQTMILYKAKSTRQQQQLVHIFNMCLEHGMNLNKTIQPGSTKTYKDLLNENGFGSILKS